jgi:predicted acyltransferase (DUF342 family)
MESLESTAASLFITRDSNDSIVTKGGIQVGKSVFINGNLKILNGLSMNKDLDIRGNTLVKGDIICNKLSVGNSVSFSSDLSLLGFNSILNVNSKSCFLNVDSTCDFYGGINVKKPSIIHSLTIDNQLIVSKDSKFKGDIESSGTIKCSNIIIYDRGCLKATSATFDNVVECFQLKVKQKLLAGNSDIDNLNCKNINSLDLVCSSLDSIGDAKINSNLHVLGHSILDGNLESNNFKSRGDSFTQGDIHIIGNSKINGHSTIHGQLQVYLDTVLQGNLKVYSSISSNQLVLLSTIESTSPATGSLIVNGGAGIQGNVFTRGNLVVSGTCFLYSSLEVYGTCKFTSNTDSLGPHTGSIVLSGGMGIMKSLNVGNSLSCNNLHVQSHSEINGNLVINSTDDSESFSTGALQVKGGVSISKNFYCAGDVMFTRDLKSFGNIYVGKNLNIQDSCSIQNNLDVLKQLTVYGNITSSSSLSCNTLVFNSSSLSCGTTGLAHLTSSILPGLRLTGTESGRYYNSIDLFTFGKSYTDSQYEALQLSNLDDGSFCISTRSLGTKNYPNLILRSGLKGKITLNSNGNLLVENSLSISSITLQTNSGSEKYTLVLPSTPPPKGTKSFLVSDENGVLSWEKIII